VEHRCGFGQYYLEGHEVESYVVLNPSQITAKEIFTERNAEIRSILIRQLTPVTFLEKAQQEAQITVVDQGEGDESGSNFPCSLVEVVYTGYDNPDLRDPMKFLIVSWPEKNEGFDQTALPVDPEITTCAEAQRWVSGLRTWNELHQEA
jgi:hypothetical protein